MKRCKWRVTMFRKRRPFLESSYAISIQVCGKTLLPILAPKHSHTSKKQGNRQAKGGGEVSHSESLAEYVWDGQREWDVAGVLWNRQGECVMGTRLAPT